MGAYTGLQSRTGARRGLLGLIRGFRGLWGEWGLIRGCGAIEPYGGDTGLIRGYGATGAVRGL